MKKNLIPSFRDFDYLYGDKKPEPSRSLPEVEELLKENGEIVSTEGWPRLEEMSYLNNFIPGIKVHSFGGIAPFQADGIWGPYEWYYRERGGFASLRLSALGNFPSAQQSLYAAKQEVKEFAGADSWDVRFLSLWEKLTIAPFLYEFLVNEVTADKHGDEVFWHLSGEKEVKAQWGHSSQEAYAALGEYSPILEDYLKWSREDQAVRAELMKQGVEAKPLKEDDRIFPKEKPDFSVKRL